jgi:hypothetical protein
MSPGLICTEGGAMAASQASLSAGQQVFLDRLTQELLLRDPDGRLLTGVDNPELLARLIAEQTVDTARAWAEHLGPVYDVEGVRRLLGRAGAPVSRQAVSKRRGLLALTTGSGRVVYPAFQFRAGAPLAGLAPVLDAVPESVVSRWTLASWLVSPEPALEGERPVDVLAYGQVDAVVGAARSWAIALVA